MENDDDVLEIFVKNALEVKEKSREITAVEEQLKLKLQELKRVNEVVLDRLFCNTEILVNTCTYTCGFVLRQ